MHHSPSPISAHRRPLAPSAHLRRRCPSTSSSTRKRPRRHRPRRPPPAKPRRLRHEHGPLPRPQRRKPSASSACRSPSPPRASSSARSLLHSPQTLRTSRRNPRPSRRSLRLPARRAPRPADLRPRPQLAATRRRHRPTTPPRRPHRHPPGIRIRQHARLLPTAAHLPLRRLRPLTPSQADRPRHPPPRIVGIHSESRPLTQSLHPHRANHNGTPDYGRSSNLWYGSFFPDAPPIFETTQSLAQKWSGPQRIFLWQDLANDPSPLPPALSPSTSSPDPAAKRSSPTSPTADNLNSGE